MQEHCLLNGIEAMAEETKAIILQLRPKFMELRDARTYEEREVKEILYGFARDLGCKWDEKRLRDYIETVFDFD
jgi:hypothetical protein